MCLVGVNWRSACIMHTDEMRSGVRQKSMVSRIIGKSVMNLLETAEDQRETKPVNNVLILLHTTVSSLCFCLEWCQKIKVMSKPNMVRKIAVQKCTFPLKGRLAVWTHFLEQYWNASHWHILTLILKLPYLAWLIITDSSNDNVSKPFNIYFSCSLS